MKKGTRVLSCAIVLLIMVGLYALCNRVEILWWSRVDGAIRVERRYTLGGWSGGGIVLRQSSERRETPYSLFFQDLHVPDQLVEDPQEIGLSKNVRGLLGDRRVFVDIFGFRRPISTHPDRMLYAFMIDKVNMNEPFVREIQIAVRTADKSNPHEVQQLRYLFREWLQAHYPAGNSDIIRHVEE